MLRNIQNLLKCQNSRKGGYNHGEQAGQKKEVENMLTKWQRWNCPKVGFEGIELKGLGGELVLMSQRTVFDAVAGF